MRFLEIERKIAKHSSRTFLQDCKKKPSTSPGEHFEEDGLM